MKLPKREFYTVHEVAARWGYTIGHLDFYPLPAERDGFSVLKCA